MDIIWLGHSCFRIKGKQGVVITDPFAPELGYKPPRLEADIVTISHDHPGHNNAQAVAPVPAAVTEATADLLVCLRPKIVHGPGEYDIANIWITGITSFHDNEKGAKRGKNTIYVFQMDDVTLCHLGDIGHTLSTQQIQALAGVQVLFLPVGGQTTIDGVAAAETVRTVEPKLVIPMHYRTDSTNAPLDSLDSFLKQMALKEVIPQPRLSVTRNTLPEETRVVVLGSSQ